MNSFLKKGSFFLLFASLFLSAQVLADEGKNIQLKTKSGHAFQVYVNGSIDAKRGILLIHGWWGLNDQIRNWADRFAALGYRAMAIDLYGGNVATTPDKARVYMNSVKQAEANEKYAAAIMALQQPGRKLSILGWSFGATQSLQATLVAPDKISATVMYYPFGKIIKSGDNIRSLKGYVLVNRAKIDSSENIEETSRFIKMAKDSGKVIKEYTYNAKHGFANPSVKHYSAKASDEAWRRTKEFLESQLK